MTYFVHFTFLTKNKMNKREGNSILSFDFELKETKDLELIRKHIYSQLDDIKKDSLSIVSLNKI